MTGTVTLWFRVFVVVLEKDSKGAIVDEERVALTQSRICDVVGHVLSLQPIIGV